MVKAVETRVWVICKLKLINVICGGEIKWDRSEYFVKNTVLYFYEIMHGVEKIFKCKKKTKTKKTENR